MRWRTVNILIVSAFALAGVARADDGAVRYRVQLIRGTDSDQPPVAGSLRVGNQLATTLRGPLKWKHYWQVCERKIAVRPGRKARMLLLNGREVEIDLTQHDRRAVAAFQGGRFVDRTVRPLGEAITLIGGSRDQASAWFIAVRRDQPPE
jgi:hypothetical protein